MKKLNYLIIIASAITVSNNSYSCAVTIVNDSFDPVIVTTNDPNNVIFALAPQQEKEFGDAHVKAKFTLLTKDEEGNYIQQVSVRQYACSGGKEIRLNVQDIAVKRINQNWFIVGEPGTVDLRKKEFCH